MKGMISMNSNLIAVSMLAAFLIVACNEVAQQQEVSMRIYGGFAPMEAGEQLFTVDKDGKATLQLKGHNGTIVAEKSRMLAPEEHRQLIALIEQKGFETMQDVPAVPTVADAPSVDIIVTKEGNAKKVTVNTFVDEYIPADLRAITDRINEIKEPLADAAYKQVQQSVQCGLYRNEETNDVNCFMQNQQPAGWLPYQRPEIGIPYACYVEDGECRLAQ
ncbi:hypothetical protein HYV81_01045 [Candidatus Woesearchaeota archaeon]|nr:hypothetical protein [Candidatus Woesearchaeota archaeon]